MKINLFKMPHVLRTAIVATLLISATIACQPTEQPETIATEPTAELAPADTIPPRPAPKFFVIEPGTERKRVWICEDQFSDEFHINNECPVLRTCQGVFKNVTLYRAIETYGNYNCQTCSKAYDTVFDSTTVRQR